VNIGGWLFETREQYEPPNDNPLTPALRMRHHSTSR
jgi:hypothetical protein